VKLDFVHVYFCLSFVTHIRRDFSTRVFVDVLFAKYFDRSF
jgi:hypothetical protein